MIYNSIMAETATQPITTASIINTNTGILSKNMIDVIVYYSPIILSFCVLIISVFYQTYRGLVFFIFVTFFGIIRKILFSSIKVSKNSEKSGCSPFNVFQNTNTDGFTVFFITFVTGYIVAPMFIYNIFNIYVIAFLGIYMVIVILFNQRDECSNITTSIYNVIYGIVSVALTIIILISAGLSGTLFSEDLVSDATICSMPSKQTFKCTVYKNGEIISSSTTNSGYLPATN